MIADELQQLDPPGRHAPPAATRRPPAALIRPLFSPSSTARLRPARAASSISALVRWLSRWNWFSSASLVSARPSVSDGTLQLAGGAVERRQRRLAEHVVERVGRRPGARVAGVAGRGRLVVEPARRQVERDRRDRHHAGDRGEPRVADHVATRSSQHGQRDQRQQRHHRRQRKRHREGLGDRLFDLVDDRVVQLPGRRRRCPAGRRPSRGWAAWSPALCRPGRRAARRDRSCR